MSCSVQDTVNLTAKLYGVDVSITIPLEGTKIVSPEHNMSFDVTKLVKCEEIKVRSFIIAKSVRVPYKEKKNGYITR